ncbi:MAG: hypothetical protein M1834_007995 [Cirrosporium novae-zelandiae]|nr:MAG: hypothetical protein M1834_007995 [Cirrosporium novae-zelandiae]
MKGDSERKKEKLELQEGVEQSSEDEATDVLWRHRRWISPSKHEVGKAVDSLKKTRTVSIGVQLAADRLIDMLQDENTIWKDILALMGGIPREMAQYIWTRLKEKAERHSFYYKNKSNMSINKITTSLKLIPLPLSQRLWELLHDIHGFILDVTEELKVCLKLSEAADPPRGIFAEQVDFYLRECLTSSKFTKNLKVHYVDGKNLQATSLVDQENQIIYIHNQCLGRKRSHDDIEGGECLRFVSADQLNHSAFRCDHVVQRIYRNILKQIEVPNNRNRNKGRKLDKDKVDLIVMAAMACLRRTIHGIQVSLLEQKAGYRLNWQDTIGTLDLSTRNYEQVLTTKCNQFDFKDHPPSPTCPTKKANISDFECTFTFEDFPALDPEIEYFAVVHTTQKGAFLAISRDTTLSPSGSTSNKKA